MLLPLSAQSATANHGNLIRSNSAIVARIASDRLVYHLGDPIRLRLTLTNKSADQLYVGNGPPFALVDLQVLDSGGRRLPHGSAPLKGCMPLSSSHVPQPPANLSPGKPDVIGWANINCWGYRLNEPGSYTLIATPKIEAFGPGDEFNDAPARESNAIRIVVTRGPAGPLLHYAATPNPYCPHPNVRATAINLVQPDYPESARQLGMRAVTVEVEVTVGPSGNLLDANVSKSSKNMAIDQAALRAARQSSYSPKLVNCAPATGHYLFRARFQPR